MPEIIALFTVFIPHLSATTIRQLCRVVFALLAMSGRVTMLNISRWTSQGGSYRTGQRFFNTVLPWTTICWMFFRTHLLDRESDYLRRRRSGRIKIGELYTIFPLAIETVPKKSMLKIKSLRILLLLCIKDQSLFT